MRVLTLGLLGVPGAEAYELAADYSGEGRDTVTARILVHASVQQVWRVLTEFEALVDVVPYLVECKELPSPDPKRKRLRQSAGLKCSWWKLQARATLEVQLLERSKHQKELLFRMVEGDFKEYEGRFLVEAVPDGLASVLVFDAAIVPLENIPRMLFSHAVQSWLPLNLDGIKKKAEQIALKEASISPFTEASIESQVPLTTASEDRRPRAPRTAQKPRRQRKKRANPVDYLGTAFVPLPSPSPSFKELSVSKQSTLPAFELDSSHLKGVEVHLRKLDTKEFLHRRVVCSLRIAASIESVWKVLTDYRRLADFVPNLSKSEVLSCPLGAPRGYHRIRQVVQKFQTYIQLQAESVMDILEKPFSEIQFRQVSGFVQNLQGKWILKTIRNEWSPDETDTLLTYALEIRTPHSDIPLELIEPVFEQAAIEGLPLNLTAVKQEVLKLEGRPSLARLCGDFSSLRNELTANYTKNGNVFPTRLQLREDRRTDLEKAITAHGGPSAVSAQMGWRLQNKRRKRRGYWNDFDNLKQEVLDFKVRSGLGLDEELPSKTDFNLAGRTDLRRAIEKWGGIQAVKELMALEGGIQGNAVELDRNNRKMDINVRDVDSL